jgi:hypothetical protein
MDREKDDRQFWFGIGLLVLPNVVWDYALELPIPYDFLKPGWPASYARRNRHVPWEEELAAVTAQNMPEHFICHNLWIEDSKTGLSIVNNFADNGCPNKRWMYNTIEPSTAGLPPDRSVQTNLVRIFGALYWCLTSCASDSFKASAAVLVQA